MNDNEKLIHTFYSAFANKDYKTMQDCYAEDAVFCDEVFVNLDAAQVRSMWEMLIKRGKDLVVEFKNISANEQTGSVEWTAAYTFSKTNRKVVNHVKAHFVFENGKIAEHDDEFSFYKWSGQALGLSGILLGWTGSLRKKVQQTAMQGLNDFMNKKKKPG